MAIPGLLPRMAVYESNDAIHGERFMAVFYTLNHLSRLERFPVVFVAPTREDAAAKAEKFWFEETAKEAARRERAKRAGSRAAQRHAARKEG